jgi:hypothetical protein
MKTQESEFLLIKLFRNTNPYQKKEKSIINFCLYVLVVLFIIGKIYNGGEAGEFYIILVIKFHRM